MSASGITREDQSVNLAYVLPEGKIVPNTVFVGGIDVRMEEIDIKEFSSKFGNVKEVKIITDRTGMSKGYGFVSFYDDVDVQKIVESQISFHGKRLKLGPAIRKQNASTYLQQRPIIVNSPAPQYHSMWNNSVSDPLVHQPPLYSPVTQYLQACPYPSSAPMMYQMPVGYQQPGCYPLPQHWPNGDQRSLFLQPQPFTSWHYNNEADMASNDMFPPEMYFQEQNVSPVSTSPQKKVDRSIQTILSCFLNGDGRLQRSIVSQEEYMKKS
uniref:DAZ-like protein n=1 Tax=Eleutherodactylus coqui TaxID=57060 RepID=G8GFR8_ELECQ|nr:DAZ-like protein [Eleutherodactylus coqui]